MKRFLVLSLALSMGVHAQTPGVAVWPKALRLQQQGGALLACLPPNSEPMPLQAAAVAQIDGGWPPEEWAIVIEPHAAPLTLHGDECIAYEADPKGYKQIGGSQPLRAGETYGFMLQKVGDTGNASVGRLIGVFCVEQSSEGTHTFLPYIEHADGTTTYPRCGKYTGSPPAIDGFRPADTPTSIK